MENMKDFEQEIEKSFENMDKLNNPDAAKWEKFEADRINKVVYDVKVKEVVKAGLVTYIDEIRAFIPISQVSDKYIESLEEYQDKNLQVVIITADEENRKLVLSHRVLAQEARQKELEEKLAQINVGDILEGKVETVKDYGVFVSLFENINGLLHISQISNKRIKSPKSVLSIGDVIKVQVISKEDNKISLSKKVLEQEEFVEKKEEKPFEYKEKEKATTSLADLLKDLKF